jgi:hypothetical protein
VGGFDFVISTESLAEPGTALIRTRHVSMEEIIFLFRAKVRDYGPSLFLESLAKSGERDKVFAR